MLREFQWKRKKNWSRITDGGLIPEQTGRLSLGRKIIVTWFWFWTLGVFWFIEMQKNYHRTRLQKKSIRVGKIPSSNIYLIQHQAITCCVGFQLSSDFVDDNQVIELGVHKEWPRRMPFYNNRLSSETSVLTRATWHNLLEDGNPHSHSENLKFYKKWTNQW
jgi:hypothetical protein